jgi:serine/threonine protein kinase
MSDTDSPTIVLAAQETHILALPAGTRLQNYEIVSVIGQGSFGVTYRARDTRLHRDVAIKEYLPDALAVRYAGASVSPRSTRAAAEFVWGRESFLKEAQILAQLQHVPAVVPVFEFLEANGTGYMVMALAEGETLQERLKREEKLSPSTVESLLFPLLNGLEEVHARGYLHRDIKPGNIVVDSRGNPTLIDFGAARAAVAGRSSDMTSIYTPGYAPAEQYTTSNQGAWTDIYGLAATFYHALTGQKPPDAMDRAVHDTYEPLGLAIGRGIPDALAAGIDSGLAYRFNGRPQTIAEWRRILTNTSAEGASTKALRLALPPAPQKAKSSGRARMIWTAAGVVLLAVGGGYFLLRDVFSPPAIAEAPPTPVSPTPAPPAPTPVPAPAPPATSPPRDSAAPPAAEPSPTRSGLAALAGKDYGTAFRLLFPEAQKGDALAQSAIGDMYIHGQGVSTDLAQGLKWLKLAAAKGAPSAEFSLATIYDGGIPGVPHNAMRAYAWYALAAHDPRYAAIASGRMATLTQQMPLSQVVEAQNQAAMAPRLLVEMP